MSCLQQRPAAVVTATRICETMGKLWCCEEIGGVKGRLFIRQWEHAEADREGERRER